MFKFRNINRVYKDDHDYNNIVISKIFSPNCIQFRRKDKNESEMIMKLDDGIGFNNDIYFSRILNRFDITPNFIDMIKYDGRKAFIMEKFDYAISDLMDNGEIYKIKLTLFPIIDELVNKLHSINVCHGDLHTGNIVVNLYPLKVRLIDFEFSIFKSEFDPKATQFIDYKYASYEDFVARRDFYWKEEFNNL